MEAFSIATGNEAKEIDGPYTEIVTSGKGGHFSQVTWKQRIFFLFFFASFPSLTVASAAAAATV